MVLVFFFFSVGLDKIICFFNCMIENFEEKKLKLKNILSGRASENDGR